MRSWIEEWMFIHAITLLAATLLLGFINSLSYLFLPALGSFLLLYYRNYHFLNSSRFIGQAANLVTSFRLFLLFILHTNFTSTPLWLITCTALVILLLDGVDGYLARKQNTSSPFGEYLDMETDAFYVLCLTSILYQLQFFDFWILGIGLLRYAYFLVLKNVKPPEQKEARAFRAQLIAVILMASLALSFVLSPAIREPVIVVASALVVYSFGESFWAAVKR